MQQVKSRPTGVTIIAILNIIGGIVMLIAGTALIAVGALSKRNQTEEATHNAKTKR